MDFRCNLARAIINRGVYLGWVQNRVVQAQYFRDYEKLDEYFEKNIFLPDLNNEKSPGKNKTYKTNLSSVNTFVMVKFTEDDMLIPPESAWFSYYNSNKSIIPLREQSLYKEVLFP